MRRSHARFERVLSRRQRQLALSLLAIGLCLGCSGGERRPHHNLLLVTIDTARADYFTGFGAGPYHSPNIGKLAENAAIFTRAFSDSNLTSPAHLSVMSGMRPLEHGVHDNHTPVPEGIDTLAEAMKRAGYRTGGFAAVQHIGPRMGWRGFDELPGGPVEFDGEAINQRALYWLFGIKGAPFFLWVHYWEPHALYLPPQKYVRHFYRGDPFDPRLPPIARLEVFRRIGWGDALVKWLGDARDPAYPRALYAAEVRSADSNLGALLAGMAKLGLTEQTVLVIAGDHGESLGEHGIYYSHSGLYEQQLHIPLLIRVPGLPPVVSDVPVSQSDIAPTIAELFDLEVRNPIAGRSLVPLLRGVTDTGDTGNTSDTRQWEERVFLHHHEHNAAVAVRDGAWKVIWPIERDNVALPPRPQLFDLESDPGELHDLAEQHPERIEAVRPLVEPYLALGLSKGSTEHLDQEGIDQLRALGYLHEGKE